MPKGRGINVPDAEGTVWQEYKDSTVWEYFEDEALRDARVSQLKSLGRVPIPWFAHDVGRGTGLTNLYVVQWNEPRGEEQSAVRARS